MLDGLIFVRCTIFVYFPLKLLQNIKCCHFRFDIRMSQSSDNSSVKVHGIDLEPECVLLIKLHLTFITECLRFSGDKISVKFLK